MTKTKIEWSEFTWSPVTGCTKIAPGCKNCYAERMSHRFKGRYGYPADEPFRVTLHPNRLEEPLRWRKPRHIFVCSMGDLFHEDVPAWFVHKIINTVYDCPKHTFQILTKRPDRMYRHFTSDEWKSPWYKYPLPNLWLGTSVSTQEDADRNIPWLLKTPAAVRFVSAEPLLEEVYLQKFFGYNDMADDGVFVAHGAINQVIVGCESGPRRRPMELDWARSIVDQCREAGVACFVKQIEINGKVEHDIEKFPEDLQVREMPNE